MSTSAARTPLALLVFAALVPLSGCGGEAESAQAGPPERIDAVQQAVEQAESGTVDSAPVEPVPPVVEPSLQPAPAAQPGAPRPRPTPRPAVQPGDSRESARPVREALFVPEGTLIEATVDSELSTQRSLVGDRFFATVTDDVLGANGAVLVPAGSTINARVTESRASTGADQPAVLIVEVESIGAGAVTLPLRADVVELESEVQARDSNTQTATKVGVGAVAGAIIGRILGDDRKDAAKGAVVGAAAGAAVAVAQRDGHAVVKPGARIVVRLTERLFVE